MGFLTISSLFFIAILIIGRIIDKISENQEKHSNQSEDKTDISLYKNEPATSEFDLDNDLGDDYSDSPFKVSIEHDYPHYPRENFVEERADSYILNENGDIVGRTDGNPLSDADMAYVIRKNRENAIAKQKEIRNRGFSNTIIHNSKFNPKEKAFFDSLTEQLISNDLNPGYISLNGNSEYGFRVYYRSFQMGYIYLPEQTEFYKYRVVKKGNTRATRVFDDLPSAEQFINDKNDYEIETQVTTKYGRMQCMRNYYDVYMLEGLDVSHAIKEIPCWIKYIKKCLRDESSALRI